MSGSTIGGVLGAAVGFWVGGAAGAKVGWMVGSAVGGYVDPEVIKAPSIGDAQTQTSSDGVPIAVVYGTPPPFMGNVIDGEAKARKIIVEEGGKGGPVVEQERFLLTSAIGICEGEIEGVAFIIQDGNLVYDKRPNPKIPASETAKFASKIRLYLGTETQNPDPALEAIHGVGETCYYRGLAYMVIVDDDRTQSQGRVGQYAFGVVKNGVTTVIEEDIYPEPQLARFQDTHWPLVDAESDYAYIGYLGNKGLGGSGGSFETYSADTIAEIIAYFAAFDYGPYGGGTRNPIHYLGYSATTTTVPIPDIGLTLDFGVSNAVANPTVVDNEALVLVYNDLSPTSVHDSLSWSGFCGIDLDGVEQDVRGTVGHLLPATPGGQYTLLSTCGDPNLYGFFPLCIRVTRKPIPALSEYGDPCDEQSPVLLPDSAGFLIDCDANISGAPSSYSTVSGTFKQLAVADTSFIDDRTQYAQYPVGPILESADPNYSNSVFWTAAYDAAVAAGDMPGGLTYNVDYPVEVTSATVGTITTTEIESGEFSLQEFQEDIANRCGVPADRIDATALAPDILPGMVIAVDTTGADASRVPQQVYFYDLPEFDGKIRAIKRGGLEVGTLTDDDFVSVDKDDDDVRIQEIELYKKLHLSYPDPAGNYAITKQTFFRDSINVNAKGELVIGTPIPFSTDEAAQRVDIMGKIMWASAEGKMSRTLPRKFTTWVPSDCFLYNGKRWRIERGDVADGTNAIEAIYDRKSAYESIATGALARDPTSQTSSLRGPTRFEFVNLSPLLDSHDKIGIYFGVCGILDGWQGGAVFARPLGAADYTSLGNYSNRSVMGHTTTVLPAGSPWVFDAAASVTVKVHGGAPDSATFAQLLNEANAAIIGDEVIQYQLAVEVDDYTYELTGLTRARHNTAVAAHAVHSRFVLLSGLNFYELPSAWIGKQLQFYIQSLGTPSGTGYNEVHTWSPARIQTEWSPVRLLAPRNAADDATEVSWIGRGRLGTNAAPFQSQYFDGYRITFSLTGITQSYLSATPSFTYTDAQRTADFGSLDPLDVEIKALSRIPGGNSAALTGTI